MNQSEVLRELRALRRGLDKMREELRAQNVSALSRDGAVKRAVAAKLMGIGVTKLVALIAAGKVRTAAEDEHLVPMSEVRRYCTPKAPRGRGGGRRPAVVIDTTSPEAIAAYKRDLRKRRAGA